MQGPARGHGDPGAHLPPGDGQVRLQQQGTQEPSHRRVQQGAHEGVGTGHVELVVEAFVAYLELAGGEVTVQETLGLSAQRDRHRTTFDAVDGYACLGPLLVVAGALLRLPFEPHVKTARAPFERGPTERDPSLDAGQAARYGGARVRRV